MRDAAAILAEFVVGLDFGAGGDFALDPVLEGRLLGDFARGFEARDDGGCVIAFGVGEVAEVQRGLDGRVGRRQVDAAAGAGARDVGRHAEGVDGGVVTEAGGC